jgi:electron transfer flavoprotein alpha/beta subunit
MKAKKMPLETIDTKTAASCSRGDTKTAASCSRGDTKTAASCSPKPLKLTPPPPRPACRVIDGAPPEMARELVRLLREEAKVI